MIKNEKQYKIARAKLEKWLKNLEINNTIEQPDVPAWVVKEQGVSIAEQVRQLQAEIREYEETIEAGPKALPDPQEAVSDLSVLLIKWRIAQHLTQKDLAQLAGIHENLLQKYEQENYSGASLHTLQHIAHVLKDKGVT
jgi:HTH-type transcriptional regulator/antitoxin HigA